VYEKEEEKRTEYEQWRRKFLFYACKTNALHDLVQMIKGSLNEEEFALGVSGYR
jgi:hypothetical protein